MQQPPPGPALPTVARALLRLSLFYKLLIGNALIVFAAALLSALAVQRAPLGELADPWARVLMVSAIALAASVTLNAIIIRAALSPLNDLIDLARRVQTGDFAARVQPGRFADRDLEALSRALNSMLDTLAGHRTTIRSVAARVLDAAESERLRVGRELHDDTAQSLAALLIQLKLAKDATDPEQRNALISSVSQGIGLAVEELRRISQELRPPALDMLGLRAALEAHARSVSEASGVRIEVEARSIDRQASPESELVLYRLVQDALSNVVKHAGARFAKVEAWREDDHVVATVSDQGRGFSVEDKLRDGALGLIGMRERASYVGGSVSFEAEPGQGSRVRIEVPILRNGKNV